jgi:hypothetical protein
MEDMKNMRSTVPHSLDQIAAQQVEATEAGAKKTKVDSWIQFVNPSVRICVVMSRPNSILITLLLLLYNCYFNYYHDKLNRFNTHQSVFVPFSCLIV